GLARARPVERLSQSSGDLARLQNAACIPHAAGPLHPPGQHPPGLRPATGHEADQKRIVTPRKARDDGASVLVIGRPISRAEDPVTAARAIEATL
ncbi:MAG TPA: orotidine 5'-phosphate decarboxylase, partial [Novosphingobium sp.]|nr:orotidine 5'-phosphate decarboxylase [Novosphingobium sp.]